MIGHEIFFKIFDGPQYIFLCSISVILFFKLSGLEHKISTLAIKETEERQGMLNKSHLLSRCQANGGKNKKNCLMYFDFDAMVFDLAIDTRYNFVTNFLQ